MLTLVAGAILRRDAHKMATFREAGKSLDFYALNMVIFNDIVKQTHQRKHGFNKVRNYVTLRERSLRPKSLLHRVGDASLRSA
jgi:hypothetical protein